MADETTPVQETPEIPDDSILKTIRQMIGPSVSYEVFDTDLIVHINAAFSRLCQLGVGPIEIPFRITGSDECWEDFGLPPGYQEEIKQYIYLKVKLIFDPPASSAVLNAYQETVNMLEWTLREVSRFGY